MPTYDFVTLDVFTDKRFGGNLLAVVPYAAGLDTGQMQTLARESNLSETTFVLPPEDARGFEALLAAFLHGLQTAPEALLAALPEIDLVLLGEGVVDVLDAERDELGMRSVRPGLDEARHGLAAFAAEQRRAIRVGLFEIERDVEAVAHDSSAILDHGHGLLAAADRFDPCEGRRLRLEGEALVRQRHLGPPAIGAEAAPVGCREVVKHDRHAHPLA